jgi:PhoH-like ATPase
LKQTIFVLDTNVLLTDSNSILNFGEADIVIPLKVLDEIDKHKKRQDSVGVHARSVIRKLDELRADANLFDGADIGTDTGKIYVKGYDPFKLPDDLDIENPDNQIIATALSLKAEHKKSKIILVSRDINMRVKCDALKIDCEDYSSDQVVEDIDGLYTGLQEVLVDEQIVDSVYKEEGVFLDPEEVSLEPNQFVMLISNSNEKKSALVRFINYETRVQKVDSFKKGVWGVRPKNKEQNFALDLLMDPDVPLVTIIGKAGSGKTLMALACGLQQCFGETANDRIYSRVIVTKPVEPVGKDIGFLPGTMEEKMMPWVAPIQDNLKNLMGNDQVTLGMYMDEGKIEVEAMTFIRGRSIGNAFIIIDEAQNMTKHEIKTVLTRVGEGTKIVLTGDIEQIDNVYLDETTNGLTYVIDRFKDQSCAGHITLVKGERSKIATLAAKLL